MEQLDDRKVQGGLDLAHRLTWHLADRAEVGCGVEVPAAWCGSWCEIAATGDVRGAWWCWECDCCCW